MQLKKTKVDIDMDKAQKEWLKKVTDRFKRGGDAFLDGLVDPALGAAFPADLYIRGFLSSLYAFDKMYKGERYRSRVADLGAQEEILDLQSRAWPDSATQRRLGQVRQEIGNIDSQETWEAIVQEISGMSQVKPFDPLGDVIDEINRVNNIWSDIQARHDQAYGYSGINLDASASSESNPGSAHKVIIDLGKNTQQMSYSPHAAGFIPESYQFAGMPSSGQAEGLPDFARMVVDGTQQATEAIENLEASGSEKLASFGGAFIDFGDTTTLAFDGVQQGSQDLYHGISDDLMAMNGEFMGFDETQQTVAATTTEQTGLMSDAYTTYSSGVVGNLGLMTNSMGLVQSEAGAMGQGMGDALTLVSQRTVGVSDIFGNTFGIMGNAADGMFTGLENQTHRVLTGLMTGETYSM